MFPSKKLHSSDDFLAMFDDTGEYTPPIWAHFK